MLLPNLICKVEKEKKKYCSKEEGGGAYGGREGGGGGEGETEHYKSFNHNAMKYVYRK